MHWLFLWLLKTLLAVFVVVYWFHWSETKELMEMWGNLLPTFERAYTHGR